MTHGRPTVLLLAALLVLPVGCGAPTAVVAPPPSAPSAAEQALAAGTRYLLDRQAADGAWRSDRYGHFRGGDALTPLVLSALLEARAAETEPACRRGDDADGGFFFLHHDGERNKAGPVDAAATPLRYRSYGSTTADGLRALLACGLPADHARVRAARHWIECRFEAGTHPGDFVPQRESSRNALSFYYTASLCRALRAVGATTLESPAGTVSWHEAVAAELVRRQHGDGSWSNEVASMREDDPVLATAWAVTALALCLRPGPSESSHP